MRCPGPIRLRRSRCSLTACKTHPRTFIPLQGVALVCSECETKETSKWYGNMDDAGKPVCVVCYKRQVRHVRRSHASIFQILYRHILTQYPRCVFSQLAASRGKCSGCGKDGANTSHLSMSKLKKEAWYCQPFSTREVRISGLFSLSLSLPKRPRRYDDFRHKLFRLDSRRSSSVFFAGAGHRNRRGNDVRGVRDGYGQWPMVQLER